MRLSIKKHGRLCVAALFILSWVSMTPLAGAAEPYKNTILPSDNVPGWVTKQRKNIVAHGQFPLPKRNWQEAGLPPGLEKQVWDAWAPGAKRRWRSVSPGYTNVIYDAKINDNIITLLLDGGVLVQSKDGGNSWKPLSHHLTEARSLYRFDISPADSNIIAVAGVTIDRSLNGGRSWGPVIDSALPPFKPMKIVQGKSCQDGEMAFGFVRFNADGSRVFASPGAFGHSFVQRSGCETEMASWLKRKLIYIGDGKVSNFKTIDLGNFAAIRFILPHFSNPDLVYVSFSDGSIYVCRNARAETPVFTELIKPDSLKGLQATWMDVSPEDPSMLLLTLLNQGNKSVWQKSRLVLARVSGNRLECETIKAVSGEKGSPPVCARWNPHNPKKVFVGIRWGTSILVSEDNMKNFQRRELPKELFPRTHTTSYASPRNFAFDRKSDLAVVYSVTGAWSSRDGFKHVEELVMTHNYDKKLYGNKGVAFAECPISVAIRPNYTYMATNDHGAWRSNGTDTSKWQRISDNPGMPKFGRHRLTYPMAVSEDEQYILLVARLKDWGKKDHKLMLSKNKGDTWIDITERLDGDAVVKSGIIRIFFDPKDAKRAWVLTRASRLFFTSDGCKTFKDTGTKINIHQDFAYDPLHKILYSSAPGARIMRSKDMGFTWTTLPRKFSGIVYAMNILANGDLVVGDDGRLLVIPFNKIESGKIEQSMIRLTIGRSLAESACGLRTFKPIFCRGMNILTGNDNGWNRSNANRGLGPLLSRDGGKTFQWITYDLPCARVMSFDIGNGKIIIGNRGAHELDLKSSLSDTAKHNQ